eukprot:CAMPEP_0118680910 /NCGR_PEP_ID=MMETSP0800-20121206/4640_1 /TAXON_ID=210618 ORGANISM="Striatella unipunctata, Strain CCMP2910" /NCGR_SAMPLE_ID=MMETSP0800 /ASSEMBLY_ACC=CAM_ASM_000638 /LENGTH=37 /DNA_ID= /DNA_START= /DNA_END= /DNA_ORIENTATION=
MEKQSISNKNMEGAFLPSKVALVLAVMLEAQGLEVCA